LGIFSKSDFAASQKNQTVHRNGALTRRLPMRRSLSARPITLGVFMDKMLFALSLGFAGLIFATQAALAAQCAPREQVVAGLATRFDEVLRGAGLTAAPDGRAQVVEIFTSASGSWTIVVTRPDGQTCLVASGQAWEDITEELPAKGEPA
jgi:hypothetical protein